MADPGCAERLLLYGVLEAGDLAGQAARPVDAELRGAFDRPCALVSAPPLAVIVSRLPADRALHQPKTEDLVAYSRVLAHVHGQTTVVPLRFGSVLADEAAVRAYLADNTAAYEQLLARLRGTEELAVRLVLPAAESRLPATAPPTAAAGAGAAYLRARQLHHAQTEHRQAAGERRAEWLRQGLRPGALASRVELIKQGDDLAVSAAFLIRRGTAAALRARARELAAQESLKLTVSGPFPPFSFAELATETPAAPAKAQ